MEEIEQKLEEIRTKALEPLKLLVSTKAILFTRSTKMPPLNGGVFSDFTLLMMSGDYCTI